MKENKNRKELQTSSAERPPPCGHWQQLLLGAPQWEDLRGWAQGFFREGYEARQGTVWAFVSGDGEGTLAGRIIF